LDKFGKNCELYFRQYRHRLWGAEAAEAAEVAAEEAAEEAEAVEVDRLHTVSLH
jgi:hypothetical protein